MISNIRLSFLLPSRSTATRNRLSVTKALTFFLFADCVIMATAVAKYSSQLWLSIGHSCGQISVTAVAMMNECR